MTTSVETGYEFFTTPCIHGNVNARDQKCFEVIANKREKEKSHERYDWNLISTLMKDNTFMELANLCLPNNSDVDKDVI